MNLEVFLASPRTIHFIGIGGVSMHALAIFLANIGHKVTGSDASESIYDCAMLSRNIKLQRGHKVDLIKNADLVVYTGAVHEDNTERLYAATADIPTIDRAVLLTYICSRFPHVLAVSGTHGKTTTCAMLYSILQTANANVSCHIGGDIESARIRMGDEYLVVEACEFNKSFLNLRPYLSAVLNVEADHMDSYGNLKNLQNAFLEFLSFAKLKVIFDCSSTKFITDKIKTTICGDETFFADNIVMQAKAGITQFDLVKDNIRTPVLLHTLGCYNVDNATMAGRIADSLGFELKQISAGLEKFRSVARRSEKIGRIDGCDVIIDYAHHPTEVECFLSTMKSVYHKVLCVFQPHTYSRTANLLKEFLSCFDSVDDIVIYKEYPAREKPSQGLSAKGLQKKLSESGKTCSYVATKENLIKKIKKEHDAILFIGAGDIDRVARDIVRMQKV